MKRTVTKIATLGLALLGLTTQAQWTENASSVYLTNGTKNLGVGTTAPSYNLDIKQDFNCSFRVQSKVNGSSNMILSRSTAAGANCLVNYKTGTTALWYTGCQSNDDFRINNGANTTMLTIKQTGNVGVGTIAPVTKLDIIGKVKITDGTQAAGYVLMSDATGIASWSSTAGLVGPAGPTGPIGPIGLTGATGPAGALPASSTIGSTPFWNGSAWDYNSSNIFNTGTWVGIGTSTPSEKLQVSGNELITGRLGLGTVSPVSKLNLQDTHASDAFIRMVNTTKGPNISWAGIGASGDWAIRSCANNGTVVLQDQVGGSVGIGTSTPSEKLQVSGNELITGRLGLGTVSPVSKLNIEYPHPTDALLRLVNTTKGPNISWAGIGASGDWTLRSSANVGVVCMQDQAGGRIGLGTTNPSTGAKTELYGASGVATAVFTSPLAGQVQSWVHYGATGDWYVRSALTSGKVIIQDLGGPVCIGTVNPATGYKLSVKGKIMCEELRVLLNASWPDYVFAKDYDLMSLNDLQKFVDQNQHLPGVKSAEAVNEDGGVSVGEMQQTLLKKIEESNLYILQLNKRIEELEAQAKK